MASTYSYFVLFYCLLLPSVVFSKTMRKNPCEADGMSSKSVMPLNDENSKTELHSRVMRQAPVPVPRPLFGQADTPADPQEELLRYERINRGFEKMLQFVTIAGQVDSYLADRAKSFINRLSKLTEDDDGSNRLQSRRRCS